MEKKTKYEIACEEADTLTNAVTGNLDFQIIETTPGDKVQIELTIHSTNGAGIVNNIIGILDRVLRMEHITRTKTIEEAARKKQYEIEQIKSAMEILLKNIKKI